MIDVKTSDVAHASTDSRVYVVLCGEREDSEKLWLEGGHFDRGKTENFRITLPQMLSPLRDLRVGTDYKGRRHPELAPRLGARVLPSNGHRAALHMPPAVLEEGGRPRRLCDTLQRRHTGPPRSSKMCALFDQKYYKYYSYEYIVQYIHSFVLAYRNVRFYLFDDILMPTIFAVRW